MNHTDVLALIDEWVITTHTRCMHEIASMLMPTHPEYTSLPSSSSFPFSKPTARSSINGPTREDSLDLKAPLSVLMDLYLQYSTFNTIACRSSYNIYDPLRDHHHSIIINRYHMGHHQMLSVKTKIYPSIYLTILSIYPCMNPSIIQSVAYLGSSGCSTTFRTKVSNSFKALPPSPPYEVG